VEHVVRVWDAVGADQVLKAEYKVLGGKMCVLLTILGIHLLDPEPPFRNDLSWDGESKRIIAVGDGREK
jgi:WD repeat-containing protein 1 (actin-interacting protein 1)